MSGSGSSRKSLLDNTTILVTGAAGFIGASLAAHLLASQTGSTIIGLDNLNDYYDPALKQDRLDWIGQTAETSSSSWRFIRASLSDREAIDCLFRDFSPSIVVHLAAQAGVRYSIDHPDAYIESNIIGFYNMLEACRHHPVAHLIYASSSSVYGNNEKAPFSTSDKTDCPVSLYAATKKSDELLAYAYSSLYNIPMTGLRFFTVYGPFGRPDMFIYSATHKLIAGETIQLYNYGNCLRDFTYIDDIVEGVVRVMQAPHRFALKQHASQPAAPHALYNIGGGHPERVMEVVSILQEELERAGLLPPGYDAEAHRELVGMQPGDVLLTYADTEELERDYGFAPQVGIREGIRRFVSWYATSYDGQ